MTETWAAIPSLPGFEASSLGRVRGEYRAHGRGYRVSATFGVWHRTDRRYVMMIRRKNYRVAALVAEAFHGPRPDGLVVMHIDEDSRNNRPGNLAYGTQREKI